MDGTYFPTPTFPSNEERKVETKESEAKQVFNVDKILINNIGKSVIIYCSFKNSNDLKDKDFTGRLEYVNENYIVISNVENGEYHFIPIKYVNYITFKEKITF